MQLEISQLDLKYAHLRVNDPSDSKALLASVAESGQQAPVLVVGGSSESGYILIDGYRRVAALSKLALDHVDAVLLSVPEAEALVQGYRLSRNRRPNALEEGWLLLELMEVHGHRQCNLGSVMGRSSSWVSRRLSLVKVLPQAVQQAVRQGKIPAQGAMKSLVPLARANKTQCVELVINLKNERPSVRQLDQLYKSWKDSNPIQQKNLIEAPGLFLKAMAESKTSKSSPSKTVGEAALTRDLEILVSITRRCRRHVRDGVLQRALNTKDIQSTWQELTMVFGTLSRQIQKEIPDAGPRPANSHSDSGEKQGKDPQDRPGTGHRPQGGQESSFKWGAGSPPANPSRTTDAAPANGARPV
ncbi:MAG: hypothetical protein DRH08_09295 [Deltaproteobacteria bacterium]|nr:MAG: hypothetical protein DRH08_09295 [Deltaproteobacteria bacterium]